MSRATFTPVTVTAETLAVLTKQPDNAKLMALYMHYVEMTTWQGSNSIRATTSFMAERLHWNEVKVRRVKKALGRLGLVKDSVRRHPDTNQVTGHYVRVHHVVAEVGSEPEATPPPIREGGTGYALDSGTPSAVNSNTSAYNSKGSASTFSKPSDGGLPPTERDETGDGAATKAEPGEQVATPAGEAPPALEEPAARPQAAVRFTDDDVRLSGLLSQLSASNFPHLRPPQSGHGEWAEMNRLHRLDGYPYPLIEAVLRWSQADDFWRVNIRSVGKFRKQFDALAAKAGNQARVSRERATQWI